ncbi:chemotaxis protein CheA [Methylotuvimicrobium buryatense]|uniref:Chemotaxis protein CheA n=1 Tax=Methylotuvimicrobium buryatense TaxID=95641 RepID=A0A4P9UQR2_METBY|nr:chemotaxis protein CheA [Methylotuvimicrobium buryatense]QCW82621.1 chemotaxis protein CheA [Methylotuvimicrobium buryatense]
MNLDEALQTFIEESSDLLTQMEEALILSEQSEEISEIVNVLFRAAHTIKGSAGLFGFDHIVSFTHVVESLLDRVRTAELELTSDLIALLMYSRDHIADLLEDMTPEPGNVSDELREKGDRLVEQLKCHLGSDESMPTKPNEDTSVAPNRTNCDQRPVRSENWHISLRFAPDILKNGMEPFSFLRYLSTYGDIDHVCTVPDAIPSEEKMDPEISYLGYELSFKSRAERSAIDSTFDFIRDGSQIRLIPPHADISEYIELITILPESNERVAESIRKCGSLTQEECRTALSEIQRVSAADRTQVSRSDIEASPPAPKSNPSERNATTVAKNGENRFIRVDSVKLDRLIDLIGELIIAGASTSMVARKIGVAELRESTSILSRLVEEVRNTALNLRMVQIGTIFNRFQRVVRDVSQELGKDIELIVEGAETELDKTVVERIADPLMHLVRNAIDHGIEPFELRRDRGKPDKGTVRLGAYHESGSIVIEVEDDGGGLDRDVILAKAVEKGLVSEGQSMSDHEVFNLVFEAGFSTAKEVSNLSGRGVGMDVVRRNIVDLRGSVELSSRLGEGTSVKIRLPLTLAIIDGFLVGIGNATYVLPLDMVVECIELAAWNQEVGDDKRYLNLRGEVMPYLRLHEHFGISGKIGKQRNVVVLNYAGEKFGLVVEKLMGEFQTVIKPMGKMLEKVQGISGFTILGGGDVALVLDVPGLMRQIVLEHEREEDTVH